MSQSAASRFSLHIPKNSVYLNQGPHQKPPRKSRPTMATALKITHDSPMLALDILGNIQDMPCPYLACPYLATSMTDATVFPCVSSIVPPARNLDADIKTMLVDRGLTPREVDAVYQHAAALFVVVSGRTDTDGMTNQLMIADHMCDLFLAARKMR